MSAISPDSIQRQWNHSITLGLSLCADRTLAPKEITAETQALMYSSYVVCPQRQTASEEQHLNMHELLIWSFH